MTAAAEIGGTAAVLAIIGLVVGLIVFFVVVFLLQSTLAPLLKVLASVQSAKTAPMLERGVPGTDQLGQTRRLAETVPELALAYLGKLGANPAPPPPPAPAPVSSYSSAAPPASSPPPAPAAAPEPDSHPEMPAWKKYGR